MVSIYDLSILLHYVTHTHGKSYLGLLINDHLNVHTPSLNIITHSSSESDELLTDGEMAATISPERNHEGAHRLNSEGGRYNTV